MLVALLIFLLSLLSVNVSSPVSKWGSGVSGRCSFPVAAVLDVAPLDIQRQEHSCLFTLSSLSGSFKQGLEYIKNFWVLSSRQLWSVFLQPIGGADLVPEGAD